MSTLVSATPAGLGTIARRRPTTATSAVRRNRRKIGKRTRWPDRHRRSMASPPRNRKRKPATAKPPPTVNTEEALLYYFFSFFFLLSFRYISSAVIYQCFLSGFTCALRTHSARRTDEESGSSHVSSLTMVLAVILVVKAGLLCIAIVAVLYRYIFGLACFRCCLKPRMLYN